MSKAMEWLNANAPGFNLLSGEEQSAITDFALLWSLFESRVLDTRGNASAICRAVKRWDDSGRLAADLFDDELMYFTSRYYADNAFTYHFGQLNFGGGDHKQMVCAVLTGTDIDPQHRLSAALIIVYRYRNNLFHGVKWEYELAGQLGNFNAANKILMKTLDRYAHDGN